jgi:hypothetical protein
VSAALADKALAKLLHHRDEGWLDFNTVRTPEGEVPFCYQEISYNKFVSLRLPFVSDSDHVTWTLRRVRLMS